MFNLARLRDRLATSSMLSLLAIFASPASSLATQSDWQALSQQVSGRLHDVSPLPRPCFSTFNGKPVQIQSEECSIVQQNYLNQKFRTEHYAGYFHLYGDGCISNTTNQCLLDQQDPDGPIPTGDVCNQGVLPPRFLEVTSVQDVQSAFEFARKTGTRLSIKSSGHDYMGRSSVKGSLGLWTRHLSQMEFHESFKPAGSGNEAPVMAITFGAGVNSDEAQAFAKLNNVTIVGPSSPTVSIVGGFSLFGGHSVLSPSLGLAADRLLEIEIVTPDGKHRVCNLHKNADLFWALRGAGGGSFGVIMNATIRVEPVIPVTLALLSFSPTSANSVAPFISLLVNSTSTWSAQGWGGPMSSSSMALVNPFLNKTDAAESLASAVSYVQSVGGSVSFMRFSNFADFYTEFIAPTPSDVATGPLLSFRVIPKRFHETSDGRKKLLGFLMDSINKGKAPTFFMTTPAQYKYVDGSTSMHPAWRNSYWDVGFSTGYAATDDLETRKQIAEESQELETELQTLAPDGAAYPNESNPWVKNWQAEYWGDNYPKLSQIKAKFDPDGLLDCWKCVGFQDVSIHSNSAFECMGAFDDLA